MYNYLIGGNKMAYVDGFVAAVPTLNKDKFIQHSLKMAAFLKTLGAIKIVDCWGDDVPDGKVTSFPMAVKKEENETVVFSWIIWPDKATRDAGMEQMMDPQNHDSFDPMPFDGKRLIFGGFDMIVEA